MNKNLKRFILALKSLLFSKDIIKRISILGDIRDSQDLLFKGTLMSNIDHMIFNFLQFLY